MTAHFDADKFTKRLLTLYITTSSFFPKNDHFRQVHCLSKFEKQVSTIENNISKSVKSMLFATVLLTRESRTTTHYKSRPTSTDPVQKETCHNEEDTPTSSNSRPPNPITPPTSQLRVYLPLLPPHDPLLSLVEAGPALSLDKTGRVPHSMIGPSSRSGRDPVRFPRFWKVKFLKWVADELSPGRAQDPFWKWDTLGWGVRPSITVIRERWMDKSCFFFFSCDGRNWFFFSSLPNLAEWMAFFSCAGKTKWWHEESEIVFR